MAWMTIDMETKVPVIRFDEPPPAKHPRFEEYTPHVQFGLSGRLWFEGNRLTFFDDGMSFSAEVDMGNVTNITIYRTDTPHTRRAEIEYAVLGRRSRKEYTLLSASPGPTWTGEAR